MIKNISALIACVILFSELGYGQVRIDGQILNYDGESKIYYYPTIDGIHSPYWIYLSPSKSGEFNIEYENKGLGTVSIGINGYTTRLLHDDNSLITIVLDQNKIDKTDSLNNQYSHTEMRNNMLLSVEGDYGAFNKLYSKMDRTAFGIFTVGGNKYSNAIASATTPEEATYVYDSLINQDFELINGVHTVQEGNTDIPISEIKRFLINETKAFYSGAFVNAMFLKRKQQIIELEKDSIQDSSIYNEQWEKLSEVFMQSVSNNVEVATNSEDFNQLLFSLAYFKSNYNKYDFNYSGTLDDGVVMNLYYPDTIFYNTERTKLAYRAMFLNLYIQNQLYYSPTLLGAYKYLLETHPESNLLKHYKTHGKKLEEYIEKSVGDFYGSKIINTNYLEFTDLLEKFKGNPILIDIWATWCIPCIKEFSHKKPIEDFAHANDIKMLYISIDKVEWKKRWKKNISFNKLKGYHVQANEVLQNSMWKFIGGQEGAIPRYVLVDKDGKLFIDEAARPSDDEALLKQMQAIIGLSEQDNY